MKNSKPIFSLVMLALLAVCGCTTEKLDTPPTATATEQPGKVPGLTLQQRLEADFQAAMKPQGGKYHYEKAIEAYRELRQRPEYATNAAMRVSIAREIINLCRVPYWPNLTRWDASLQAEIPVEARAILADAEIPLKDKLPFAADLSCWQAGDNDFAAARKTLDDLRKAYPDAQGGELAALEIAYADLYRWQDDFASAWAAIERAAEGNAKWACAKARSLAQDTGDWERATRLCVSKQGEYNDLLASPRSPDATSRAEAYVRDTGNPAANRATIVANYFCGKTPLDREMRASIKPEDLARYSSSYAYRPIGRAYQYADYEHVLELMEFFKAVPGIANPNAARCRWRIVSLGAVGRRAEAARLAAERASDEKADPMDRAKFRVSQALLTGGDVAKVVEESGFEGVKASSLWRTAARQALIWGDSAAAEKCSAAFTACFAEMPRRSQRVPYFAEPINCAADWRKIRKQLDPQFCDLVYGLSLEDLATDMASGHQEIKPSVFDSDSVRAEVSTACDRNGFHIFVRIEDPASPAVRDGFAGGLNTELFLAPGEGAPYTYFYVTPTEGATYAFHTMYDNALATRPDDRQRKGIPFRSDTSFSPRDSISHLFIGWDTYYNRIPTNGSVWKFDCLARSSRSAHAWAGSQGPHHSSSWGDLVFSLTPQETAEIRRAALYRARKTWRRKGRLDIFSDIWSDWSIGDPEFYAEALAPLEKELAGAMAEVRHDMTDDDVNRIFDAVFVRCRGLRHEIDRLRREYLTRKLTE